MKARGLSEPGNEALEILRCLDLEGEEWRDGEYGSAMVLLSRARVLAELQSARELRTLVELGERFLDEFTEWARR